MGRARCLPVVAALVACAPADRSAPSGTASEAVPFAGPGLTAPFIEGAVLRLDGVLDEPAWTKAAKTAAFVSARSGARATGPLQGAARLFWDDSNLYVAFEIEDATVRGGFPAESVDPHLWERDTAELMIDPDGADNRDYYEIQINPQGLVFDSRFDDYNQPHGGDSGPFGNQEWSSRVERGIKVDGTLDDPSDKDRGYVVEAKIPWSAFDKAKRTPPADGDTWKMNFYAMQDNGGVAWSPILDERSNFHRVKFFGDVRFSR